MLLSHIKKASLNIIFSLIFLLIGIWTQFSLFFKSGFDLITGNDGDNRFLALLQENFYRQIIEGKNILDLNMFYHYKDSSIF